MSQSSSPTETWRDHLLFYEYFHGDNGAGLGASHQTGWTGLVAKTIQRYGQPAAEKALASGKTAGFGPRGGGGRGLSHTDAVGQEVAPSFAEELPSGGLSKMEHQ